MPIEVHPLAGHRELIPQVAAWLFDEWGYSWPGSTAESFGIDVEAYCRRDALPLALVALAGTECVGTAGLREHSPEFPPELTPWLVRVYVPAAWRGHGIGALLVQECEARARALGFEKLYLCTTDKQRFYEKLGWRRGEESSYLGQRVTLMDRVLGPVRPGSNEREHEG